MSTYVILLRGINVGGKNKVPMANLRLCLEELGFSNVTTYIASGNVILDSKKPAETIRNLIEDILPKTFKLDAELIKALVLSREQLRTIINDKPQNFGDNPDTYHSDVIFMINIDVESAMSVFSPRPGVDRVWPGKEVIYSERLSAERTKSRLSKIVGTPAYKSMTIRSWNTTIKLSRLMTGDTV